MFRLLNEINEVTLLKAFVQFFFLINEINAMCSEVILGNIRVCHNYGTEYLKIKCEFLIEECNKRTR